MGLTSLVTVGMSGSGVQMMLGVCLLVALLFGFRGGMLAMLLTFVCISGVAIAMTTGFIDISPERMMTSRSPIPWVTAICLFLMIVSVTVIGFQMFSTRIQESLEMLEENKRELEAKNLDLTKEIQERERAEETLRESEEKFRGLVETTSDWIWETGADGKYTYASPRGRDLLGYAPEEVVGRRPFDFMAPGEAKRLEDELARIGKEKRPFFNLENLNIHNPGFWLWTMRKASSEACGCIRRTRGSYRLQPACGHSAPGDSWPGCVQKAYR
ncbi:MAG: PAS domain S-box protein [Deltaproteobacteria bacterium]|nr:PAS domain S-box protein [Deltaproteobacteria bacterium]